VISESAPSSSLKMIWYPAACAHGAKGCMRANAGQETGSISEVALSFIVHDPRGIIESAKDKSRDCRRGMYRNISVSDWCVLKTGCCKNGLRRASEPLNSSGTAAASCCGDSRGALEGEKASQIAATSLAPSVSSSAKP